MAVTRSFLKGMGLTDEQVSAIVEEHDNTINGLKKVRDQYKEDAEKLPQVQRELDELKSGTNSWKDKYEKEHAAFEDFKSETEAKESRAKVENAYRNLLRDTKVGDGQIEAILKVTDFSNLKLGEDGKIENENTVVEDIKKTWAAFITTTSTSGANVDNPPGGSGAMTREEFDKMPLTMRMEYANEHPSEVAGFFKK